MLPVDSVDILGFYEGQPKRIALLGDFEDIVPVPIIIEEYTSVQNRTNQYTRFFACLPVYDYDEKRVRLIAAMPHQTIITALCAIYLNIPNIREHLDLVITLTFDHTQMDNLCISVQYAKKYPWNIITEKVQLNYDQIKDAVIAWRTMLGERIIA